MSETLQEYGQYNSIGGALDQLEADISEGFVEPGVVGPGAQGATSEYPFADFEELGPIGGLVLAVILGGALVVTQPISGRYAYAQWIIVAGCAVIAGAVIVQTYRIGQAKGWKAAGSWLFDGESDNGQPEQADDEVDKTPQTPEHLRNELYFERAAQSCEWCGEHVDSPEIHHIIPRSEGGPNEPSNLIVLCPNCHTKADSGMISRSKLQYKISE